MSDLQIMLDELLLDLDNVDPDRLALLRNNPDKVYIDNTTVSRLDIMLEMLEEILQGESDE